MRAYDSGASILLKESMTKTRKPRCLVAHYFLLNWIFLVVRNFLQKKSLKSWIENKTGIYGVTSSFNKISWRLSALQRYSVDCVDPPVRRKKKS